jgi:hypothetical protein
MSAKYKDFAAAVYISSLWIPGSVFAQEKEQCAWKNIKYMLVIKLYNKLDFYMLFVKITNAILVLNSAMYPQVKFFLSYRMLHVFRLEAR